MKEFSFSDLNRRSGDVLDAALAEPVSLMKRGKAKIVMLPQDEYERLRDAARSHEPRAFTLDTAPEEDIENLMAGFQEIIDEAERTPARRPTIGNRETEGA
ncbi:prevent-host-death protein [Bosea thiooxidans]